MTAARPAPRWCHASTWLHDFALITWRTDPDRLAALLPRGFAPEIRDGDAFVSMVPFVDHRFHFRSLPFVGVSCGQINYRAYVRRAEETGVWFVGTSLDSVFVALPRLAWKMPWHRTTVRLAADWDDARCRSWRLATTGWGRASATMLGTGRPLPVPAGFSDLGDARRILIDPFVGWYDRTDASGVGRYSVWHDPLALEEASVTEARSQVLTDLGLIAPDQPPLWAGVQRRVLFDVHTPPVRA